MSHRILFIVETLFALGAAQQLKVLADSLVEQRYEIHVAVLGQREFEPIDWTKSGIKVYLLNGDDKTPLHTVRDGYYVIRELRALMHTISPAIVHAWCGRSELFGLLASENFPMTKRLRRFRFFSTELFLQPEKQFTRQSLEHRLARRVERMIVPHQAVKNHLVDNGYREPRIDIVPNAVVANFTDRSPDRSRARREIVEQLGLPETTYLAGAVAPLFHRTRIKDLIWATDQLCCIRKEIHFLVIGNGSQLRRLKRFASLTEASSNVHFLGRPDSPERIIASLDFYWHSHLRDPLSGNLLSAMGNGLPSISVYGPGTKEIVRHQETGFAVNFGARDEFARWTKFLIEKPDEATKLARQGQEFVQARYPKSKMVDGYLAIYDRIH